MNRLAIILIALFILIVSPAQCSTRVIVRQGDDFTKVFSQPNQTYIIKDDINLHGGKVIIGSGSTLLFKGGSLSNGTVVGDKTLIKARNYEIFKRGFIRYRAYIGKGASKNDPPILIKRYFNCLVVEGTWLNKKCGSNWTGLQNQTNEDVMLAVKNFVTLHKEGAKVLFPSINAFGYESIKLSGGHVIDFNNSIISYPENLTVWEDLSISVPEGATACPMESGYGLLSMSSNTTVKNLSLDGKSTYRQNETIRLGVSCIVSIGDARNVRLEKVSITNVLGPAVTVQSKAKDITFKNCYFNNIGEHVVYSHQYLGYCHFEGCTFNTWDSERLSVYRDGLNYLYKFAPPVDNGNATYDEIYDFELSFSSCFFNNPIRVNKQGRTLGGFLISDFPINYRINDCKFLGLMPAFNPGGGFNNSEKSRKAYRMIVRNCNGAPYVYPAKSGGNVITEFFNCENIPFSTIYAKRYESCKLFLDVNESNIENVSSSFETEFREPLVVKNCHFTDNGKEMIINHPLFHRPVVFENCKFVSDVSRDDAVNVVSVKADTSVLVTFKSCMIDLPNFSLVYGNTKDAVIVDNCDIINVR